MDQCHATGDGWINFERWMSTGGPITTACLLHIKPVSPSDIDGYRIENFRNFPIRIGYGYSKFFGYGSGIQISISTHLWCAAEMITIRFAGWISGRIVSLQPDTDIQNLLWNGNRIRIRISESLLLIFRGFRRLEKVAHCTIIHLLSSFTSIFSAICAMTPSLSMVYSLYHRVITFPS